MNYFLVVLVIFFITARVTSLHNNFINDRLVGCGAKDYNNYNCGHTLKVSSKVNNRTTTSTCIVSIFDRNLSQASIFSIIDP